MIVEVVGAVIRDSSGRLLVVRKRGTSRFMLPGGKPAPGEPDMAALARELQEELGVQIRSAVRFGRFEADAANEPGARVRSTAYLVDVVGEPRISAEIDGSTWIDPGSPDVPLAPLLETVILPALAAASRASSAGSD